MSYLKVKNLKVNAGNKEILKGVNMEIKSGEIHAMMGPNGSGKSTLASVISGNPKFDIKGGSVFFNGKNIRRLNPTDRAMAGIFLSFQYPIEVPGLSIEHFLRTAYNNVHPRDKLSALNFHKYIKEKMRLLKIPDEFSERSLNEGFSGGEKKKSEILQLAVLNPRIAILDETDSGLDIDALKTVAEGINQLSNPKMGILIITHYFRILKYIKPDYVHIMVDGKIIKSGKKQLASTVEEKGYDWLIKGKK